MVDRCWAARVDGDYLRNLDGAIAGGRATAKAVRRASLRAAHDKGSCRVTASSIPSELVQLQHQAPAAMKLCKDCGFAALVEDDKEKFHWRCEHPTARFKPDPDYVTGK